MSERSRWSEHVAGLAEAAGLEHGDGSYPEPTDDGDAVNYLRHLADNLRAVPVARARHETVHALEPQNADQESDKQNQLATVHSDLEGLLEVCARHGYRVPERKVTAKVETPAAEPVEVKRGPGRPRKVDKEAGEE